MNLPFNVFLSSTIFPIVINRIALGLAGLGSHSFRQSVHISSLSLYPVIAIGSNTPSAFADFATALRFVRYFSSILYGCLAPVVSMRLMFSAGPAALAAGAKRSVSVAGPRASVCWRVRGMGKDATALAGSSGVACDGVAWVSMAGAAVVKTGATCV